jgi:protein-S-isoprenylcysteine O-methyltransferase Ste14
LRSIARQSALAEVALRHSLYDLPLAVLWLAWLTYWVFAARDVKPVRRQEFWASRLLTVALIMPAALLMTAPRHWMSWLGARFLPDTMVVYWLGFLMVLAGLAFAVWARTHLGRNWSGTVTVKEDHELVCSGPYAIVRHPIYAGLLLAMLGTAIVLDEWRGLVAFCFLSAAFLLKLRREERFMAESFPDTYPGYRARVPALIPLFRASRSGGGAR